MPTNSSLLRVLSALTTLLALLLPSLGAAQSRIAGLVRASGGDDQLAGVQITLSQLGRSVVSDDAGRFTIDSLTAGPHILRFDLLGYATRTDTVLVEADRTMEIVVPMVRDPVDLSPIEVTVRSPRLIATGFYDRRYRSGLSGHYVTRDDIDNRNPRAMTDLLRGMPGVTIAYDGPGQRVIRFRRYPGDVRRARGDGCVPDLYVDGVLLQDQIIDRNNPYAARLRDYDIVSPSVIEGIEVYVGAATPMQYKHPCGVVLVWTRR